MGYQPVFHETTFPARSPTHTFQLHFTPYNPPSPHTHTEITTYTHKKNTSVQKFWWTRWYDMSKKKIYLEYSAYYTDQRQSLVAESLGCSLFVASGYVLKSHHTVDKNADLGGKNSYMYNKWTGINKMMYFAPNWMCDLIYDPIVQPDAVRSCTCDCILNCVKNHTWNLSVAIKWQMPCETYYNTQ